MMRCFQAENMFSRVVVHVPFIELQKRDLPHAHCILFLDKECKDKLNDHAYIGTLITAAIPSEIDQELRIVVLKHPVHNYCGNLNPSAMCTVKSDNRDGSASCWKKLLKCNMNETTRSELAYYVMYKILYMLSGGENAIRKCLYQRTYVEKIVDNGWVVLYNTILSSHFQCHLIIEFCISRFGDIKYLFRYVCKSKDRVTKELRSNKLRFSKVLSFQDARYIGTGSSLTSTRK